MNTVHVFFSTGRFRSFAEVRAYVEATYTADGTGVPSAFMREVGLSEYEPACIECAHQLRAVPLKDLLAGASYADQWVAAVGEPKFADSAVCAFAPNVIRRPDRCSLEYAGAFHYLA